MKSFSLSGVSVVLLAATVGAQTTPEPLVSFVKDVQPLINVLCVSCHCGGRPRGDLGLESYVEIARGNRKGPGLVAGKPMESLIYKTIVGAPGVSRMPPGRLAQPTDKEVALIKRWIEEGAKDDTPPKKDKQRQQTASRTGRRFG